MLREIASGEKAHADLVAAVEKELAEFAPAFNPVNPKLGVDFPTGKWVPLSRVHSVASIGETRCAVDAYSGLWIRYGGCSPCYSNECTAYDAASGKWFVVRPPENTHLFYNEARACQGCSRGTAFDPRSRLFWINHAVGGSGRPANYNGDLRCDFCFYDAALDRFERRPADRRGRTGPTWFAADGANGRIYTEIMGPTTAVVDTGTGSLVDLKFDGAPALGGVYNHDPAAFDPVSGLFLRTVQAGNKYKDKPDWFGLWLFDAIAGWEVKSKAGPVPGSPGGGNCMIYDPLNREVIAFVSTGAFRYDREGDAWDKTAEGDGKAYVVDFDPQHNVFLASVGSGTLAAFRYRQVPAGTRAFCGNGGK